MLIWVDVNEDTGGVVAIGIVGAADVTFESSVWKDNMLK